MAVAWRRPVPARERVLFYGGGGVGKTFAALQMAAKMLGPDDKLYVYDYDNAVSVILSAGAIDGLTVAEEWRNGKCVWSSDEGGNVVIMHGRKWEDLDWMAKVQEGCTYDSVALVDSSTRLWEEVQNWYIGLMHGEDMADWLLELKRQQMHEDGKVGEAAQGLMMDGAWQVINKQWARAVKLPLLTDPDFHVICTAEEKVIRSVAGDKGKDSEEVQGMYRHVGMKPDTQKSTGHKLATVVHLTKGKTANPVRYWTMVKDWGYESGEGGQGMPDGEAWTNMATALLKEFHGWRPKRIETNNE